MPKAVLFHYSNPYNKMRLLFDRVETIKGTSVHVWRVSTWAMTLNAQIKLDSYSHEFYEWIPSQEAQRVLEMSPKEYAQLVHHTDVLPSVLEAVNHSTKHWQVFVPLNLVQHLNRVALCEEALI